MDSLFRVQKLGLILGGLLPLNTTPYLPAALKVLAPLLDNIFILFGVANMSHLMVMCSITLVFSKDASFDIRIIQIQDIATIFTAAVYILRFLFFRKNIREVISLIEQDLPTRSSPGIVYIGMGPTIRRARLFTIIWIGSCVLGTIQHGLTPLMDRTGLLPFHIHYPFDVSTSPAYQMVYTVHLVGAVQFGFTYSAFLSFFVSVCRIMTVQYEMLLCSLTNLVNSAYIRRGDTKARELLKNELWKWRNVRESEIMYYEGVEWEDEHGISADGIAIPGYIKRLGFSSPDPFEYGEYDQELCVEVVECIKRHCLILRIGKPTEDVLSFNMLNTMGNIVFVLCLIIFALSEMDEFNSNSVHFLSYLSLGYVAMLLQCYYPHLMSSQSHKIIDAIQKTPWHLFGPTVRAHLKCMMMNSQTPFHFTGGKLFNLDLGLFVVCFRATFSYFMLLRNVTSSHKANSRPK